jgi:lambda repressor-like predicted transcriptional regulator
MPVIGHGVQRERSNRMLKLSKRKILIILAKRGLSLRRLAELTGIHENNLCQMLNRRSCRPASAGRIAAALGVSVEEIIEDE